MVANSKSASKSSHDLHSSFKVIGAILVLASIFIAWMQSTTSNSADQNTAESQSQLEPNKLHSLPCSSRDYFDVPPACRPSACVRKYVPDFISKEDVSKLLELANEGMSVSPGGSGAPTILDMASGAVSYADRFASVYSLGVKFSPHLMSAYTRTINLVHQDIASAQRIPASTLTLSRPSFFSRINGSREAKTAHDEYWHEHVDKIQYGTFVYTALIYLNSIPSYSGGRLLFNDSSVVVPSVGGLLWFSSGSENPHRVEPVHSGVRWALTVAFECST
jgi:hypothetical protein